MDRTEEILAKLQQIQEQAQLTLDELPLRLAKDRLRLIIGLARYLSTTVDMTRAEMSLPGISERGAAAAGDASPPRAVPRA